MAPMSALAAYGARQQALLKLLLLHRDGLTVERLSRELGVSRNAVVQHLTSLEAGGVVDSITAPAGRGRPSRLYTLTAEGLELFPRHYDLLARALVELIRVNLGSDQLAQWLDHLGAQLAGDFAHRIPTDAPLDDQVQAVATVLHELGYEARVGTDAARPEIIASNCVFHNLAWECQQVCQLDLSLLSSLLGRDIEHRECMAKGDGCCRFGVGEASDKQQGKPV